MRPPKEWKHARYATRGGAFEQNTANDVDLRIRETKGAKTRTLTTHSSSINLQKPENRPARRLSTSGLPLSNPPRPNLTDLLKILPIIQSLLTHRVWGERCHTCSTPQQARQLMPSCPKYHHLCSAACIHSFLFFFVFSLHNRPVKVTGGCIALCGSVAYAEICRPE